MRNAYRPGMISLLFLPVLLIPFFLVQFKEKDLRMMKLAMPEENGNCETNFGNECIYQANEVNYYPFYELAPEEIESLFMGVAAARKESYKSDNYTKTWVLSLDENMEYGDIVYLINLCLKYDVKRFQLDIYKDNFAFQEVYNEESTEREQVVWDCVVIIEEECSTYDKIKTSISEEFPLNTKEEASYFLELMALYLVFCGIVLFVRK